MIELGSIEEQELSKLAGFAVNPQSQRLGYQDKKQYQLERDMSLAVIKGKSDILWLAERYAASYGTGSVPTVNQYRDYLISLLLVEFVKDTQYYEGSSSLTNHALKVWSTTDYKQIWPFVASNQDVPNTYGWGPLGSLSFYSYYSPSKDNYSEDTWFKQIEDCLRLIWLSVGQRFTTEDSEVTINDRLNSYLVLMGITPEFVLLLEELFSVTYKETAVARRREGQTLEELTFLKQRLIFGEYPESVYTEALALAPDKLKQDLGAVRLKLMSSLKPAGARLLLQAVIVECLFNSVKLLTSLETVWKDQPLVSYVKFNTYTQLGEYDVRRQVAENWMTLSDAQYLQRLFNNPPIHYTESRNVQLWSATVPDLDTSLAAPFRLTAFI